MADLHLEARLTRDLSRTKVDRRGGEIKSRAHSLDLLESSINPFRLRLPLSLRSLYLIKAHQSVIMGCAHIDEYIGELSPPRLSQQVHKSVANPTRHHSRTITHRLLISCSQGGMHTMLRWPGRESSLSSAV